MTPNIALITKPAIDFSTFLGLSEQAIGFSPSKVIDASPINLSDTSKYLSCLAALCSEQGILPNLLAHVSFSIIVVADDRDMLDILQFSNMSFVIADTLMRSVQLAIISGTLKQWKDAVKSGSSDRIELNVRLFFNRVMMAFKAADIDVWQEYECRQLKDKTLLLEDRRR